MALAFYPPHQGHAVKDIHDELVRAARRALQLDPTLAKPHVALGMAHGFRYEWDSAATEFQTAIVLDSHDVEARIQFGRYLRNRGGGRSLTQLRAARAEDPHRQCVESVVLRVLPGSQLDSALVESERALETDSVNRTALVLGAFVRSPRPSGRGPEAINRAPETSPFIPT